MIDGKWMDGKVAFVTGASSGIGRATVLAFARAGADVAMADVDAAEGARVAREIETLGRRAFFQRCDVARDAEVRGAIGGAIETFGRIDFAFNDAGVEGAPGSTADCTEENWDRVLGVNLKGVWLCMKYLIPQMVRQGGGAIVNCSSIAGVVGFKGTPAYVASKHGVVGLTKAAALEYAKSNVRVNAVCPGIIQTPMIDRFTHGEAQTRKLLLDGEPIGRIGTADEIAGAVVWLCSPGATFVTGHSLVIDGGWTAQ